MTITKAYLPFENIIKLDNFNIESKTFMMDIQDSLTRNLNQFPLNQRNDIACQLAIRIQFLFDFLGKGNFNPVIFLKYMSNLTLELTALNEMRASGWYIDGQNINSYNSDEKDVWEVTKSAFDFMWPKTTSGNEHDLSTSMAEERIKQLSKIEPSIFKKGSYILDSGCGPGRYMKAVNKTYPGSKFIGLDIGKDIINANNKRFSKEPFKFINSAFHPLPFENNTFDTILSVGVLHHAPVDIKDSIKEHLRVLKEGGNFFIFIVGENSLEMDMWRLLRAIMRKVEKEFAFDYFSKRCIPLRVQGLMDHCYGEYFLTDKTFFESIVQEYGFIKHVIPGIEGLDVTKKAMRHDKFFKSRYGQGHLRYILSK